MKKRNLALLKILKDIEFQVKDGNWYIRTRLIDDPRWSEVDYSDIEAIIRKEMGPIRIVVDETDETGRFKRYGGTTEPLYTKRKEVT